MYKRAFFNSHCVTGMCVKAIKSILVYALCCYNQVYSVFSEFPSFLEIWVCQQVREKSPLHSVKYFVQKKR